MRSTRSIRRALLSATVALVAAPLLLPAPASAAAPASTVVPAATVCTVTAADITWGFKESFRSYISGAIAHGGWEVSGGATYETPNFGFTGGTGAFDPATATGEVTFPGAIRFTGHDGLLDTQVSTPTIAFTGAGGAELRADISGTSMEAALAGDTTVSSISQVPLVAIDLSGATIAEAGDTVTLTAVDAPATMTPAGFEAFGNYEAGTPFDPITLTATASCESAEAPTPAATATAAPDADNATPAASQDDAAWLPWGIGAVVALVVSAVVSVVMLRRRRTGDPR